MNPVNFKEMPSGKSLRLAAGAVFVVVGFVLMYHQNFGITAGLSELLGDAPPDVPGGIAFAIGVFLIANAMKAD
jgi:hypothetical protein